jgi:hypothetical protein
MIGVLNTAELSKVVAAKGGEGCCGSSWFVWCAWLLNRFQGCGTVMALGVSVREEYAHDPFLTCCCCGTAAAVLLLLLLLLQSVPNTMAGTVMALDMSLGSGLRTVSPLIGTMLVQRHGFQGVCVTAAAVLLTTFSTASYLQGSCRAKGSSSTGSTAASREGRDAYAPVPVPADVKKKD